MTILSTDLNNNPIPVLSLRQGGAHRINASAISARNTAAFNSQTRVISLYATAPVYVRFGDAAVSASNTDHYFPAGTYYDFAIGGDQKAFTPYIAVLAADYDCSVFISEKS
jgi:hypothetical protein